MRSDQRAHHMTSGLKLMNGTHDGPIVELYFSYTLNVNYPVIIRQFNLFQFITRTITHMYIYAQMIRYTCQWSLDIITYEYCANYYH